MISVVAERVPVPFLIAFSLGAMGSIVACAFGNWCRINNSCNSAVDDYMDSEFEFWELNS